MASRFEQSQPLLASTTVARDDYAWSRSRAALTLFPLTVTYFLAYITSVIIFKPYVYDVVAQEFDFKGNSSSKQPCLTNFSSTHESKIADEIQKNVATIELYFSLTSYLCAAPSVLFVSPLTDKYGRKLGILFPIVGTLLKQVVYAVVIGARLPVKLLFIGHITEAVGGSFVGMLTAMFSIVSDVTEPGSQRSLRIVAMEAVQTVSASVGQYAVGQWIKTSYFYPLIYSLVVNVICLLLALFVLPETVEAHKPEVASPSTALPDNRSWFIACARPVLATWLLKLKKSAQLYMRDDHGQHRVLKRRLCLAVFILTMAVIFTGGVLELYLMKHPRCWDMSRIFTFESVQIIASWVTILLAVALMQKVFQMADRHVAIVGVLSSLVMYLFLSVAVNDVMIYEVAVLGVMSKAIVPTLRSVMSSVVDSSDQGAAYAGLGCIEALGPAVFGSLSNRVYYATLSVWDGAVFVMFAGIMVLALVLLIILNVLFSRSDQQKR